METQNQTPPQVQMQPQGQVQPQQNFNVKQTLSKLDKYNNELLNSILVILGVVSCIFFIVPLFDLKIMGMPVAGFSLAFLASLGSLVQSVQAISSSSSSSIASIGATVSAVGFISFSLFLSLVMALLPLLKQTKEHSGFIFIPALANCIIFFMVNSALTVFNNPTGSSSSSPFGSDVTQVAISIFGYIYIILQIAAILIGILILYRNSEAKKAATGMATPVNTYQGTVPSVTSQYPVANTTPVASAPTTPAPVQPQTASQPQFCPNCGNQIEPGTKFCGNCGASIN